MAARAMQLFAACVSLLLFISQQIQTAQGTRPLSLAVHQKLSSDSRSFDSKPYRNLQRRSDVAATVAAAPPRSPSAPAATSRPPSPPATRDLDNFRPTAPGHSPGVGHSAHN